MIVRVKVLLFVFMTLASASSLAITVYVTDQLQIGLHAEKTLNSLIVKVVTSGTPLELIKQEEQLSYVREPSGSEGWIDNSYISPSSSANVLLRDAENRIRTLEESLAELQQNPPVSAIINSSSPDADINLLQQQLQDERLKSSKLQTEIENLGRQIGQPDNVDSLNEKIQQLSVDNNQLQQQLLNIIENAPPGQLQASTSESPSSWFKTKNIIISVILLLGIGILIGIYILDLIHRRRHGGFRI